MITDKNTTIDKFFILGVQSQQKNNLKLAKNYYNQILRINPNHINALNNLGVLSLNLNKFQKSKEHFKKVTEINPNHYLAYFNLGIIYQKLNEIQSAIDCYENVIKINPSYADAYNNLASIYIKLGETQKTIICCEKIIEINPNNVKAQNYLGLMLNKLDETQKAKNYFENVIKIDPNYKDAHYNLGGVFKKLGDNEKSIKLYEKAIEIDPNHIKAYNNLGVIFKELGDYKKAKNCFENAIKIDPNYDDAHNNMGVIFTELGDYEKAKKSFKKVIELDLKNFNATANLAGVYVAEEDLEKAMSLSYTACKIFVNAFNFSNQSVSLFRLKHDIEQAKYLTQSESFLNSFRSTNNRINYIDKFLKTGDEIFSREGNMEDENNFDKKILLTPDEVSALLPFYRTEHIYKTKTISGSHINPNKNWKEVEDEYLNSSNQIIYIDEFLSEEALIELREFCLLSTVWRRQYNNKYLGAFGEQGFISPIHLQIGVELKKKLPKLFGPHKLIKFWGFKYDTALGKGINIHADFAVHNLNFWITPDKYNNNKNSGGLKVYDAQTPKQWTFNDYNQDVIKIYKFLKDMNAKCINVPYKFNRAVLFNSGYFHETDKIDFKNEYKGRRINNTYLFGSRTFLN